MATSAPASWAAPPPSPRSLALSSAAPTRPTTPASRCSSSTSVSMSMSMSTSASSGVDPGNTTHTSVQWSTPKDPFYGFQAEALMCERFINFLFSCATDGPVCIGLRQRPAPRLAHFIAYSLYRTRLPQEAMFGALSLLQRLKERFPFARGSAGHPLFLSAFMLASKSLCDDTYSNKSWVIVGQNYFSLVEVHHMERELFSFLDFHVTISPEDLMAVTQALNDPSLSLNVYLYRTDCTPNTVAIFYRPYRTLQFPS